MEYPKELVHKYGAKAGILMYVAKELPEIPQVDMVVSEPGETTESLLERADKFPILWPRLFRSSAVAELDGYEGEFSTEKLNGFEEGHERIAWNPNNYGPYRNREFFDRHLRQTVDSIRTSPQQFKAAGLGAELPDEINVIIAEKAPCEYVGTLVKHPNQEDNYLIAVTSTQSLEPKWPFSDAIDPDRSAFTYNHREGIKELDRFSQHNVELTGTVEQDLRTVVSWYDRIVDLSEIDKRWTYQIEFGIDPPCLFQVRPFLRKQRASFKLRKEQGDSIKPIVFGITTPEGINCRIESNVWERKCKDEPINPDNKPSAYVDKLRGSNSWQDVPNLQATILTYCGGILAHGDIRAIRQAKIAALYRSSPDDVAMDLGSWVNIVSDGTDVQLKRIKVPK